MLRDLGFIVDNEMKERQKKGTKRPYNGALKKLRLNIKHAIIRRGEGGAHHDARKYLYSQCMIKKRQKKNEGPSKKHRNPLK